MASEMAFYQVTHRLARLISGFPAEEPRPHWTQEQLAAQAERLSRVRYEAGATDLLELLDAQRTSQQAQAELAAALSDQRQRLVAVFKGIGAGA